MIGGYENINQAPRPVVLSDASLGLGYGPAVGGMQEEGCPRSNIRYYFGVKNL